MIAYQIPGEPTRFRVEGNSLKCSNLECKFIINLRTYTGPKNEGDFCPKCKTGILDRRQHTVDIAELGVNGACTCERFTMTLGPLLKSMSKLERQHAPQRCSHIKAARELAVNIAIRAYQKERGES